MKTEGTTLVAFLFQTPMAPGKFSDEAGGAAEPRRSGRIAALPDAPADAPNPNAAKGKAVNKRSAEDLDEAKEGETSVAKKVRAGISSEFLNFTFLNRQKPMSNL